MIKANLKIKEKCVTLTLNGHANQAPKGQDIVCASASILVYTVAQSLMEMRKNNLLTQEPSITLKSGSATVTCNCTTEEEFNQVIKVFNYATCGYELLEHNYPNHVQFTMDKP